MGTRSIPQKIIKVLCAKSGGRCAICKRELIVNRKGNDPITIGETAHIEGLNPNSPRYNPDNTNEKRNSYDNLIILCPTCHAKIDKDTDRYTVEAIKQIKCDHERWVEEQLKNKILDVTFAELEVITKYLENAPINPIKDKFNIIPPKEKIQRNNLSREVENLITMGMIGYNQVKDYINRHPDNEFVDRLKKPFIQKYIELKEQNFSGDELFYELLDFASAGRSSDFKLQAAGLKILVYFFEICNVFET